MRFRIKREFVKTNTSRLNGRAERGGATLGVAQLAARACASFFSGDVEMTKMTEYVRAESMKLAGDSLNKDATSVKPENKSPKEMRYRGLAKLQALPFLQSGYFRRKRMKKSNPKYAACVLLGPSPDHPLKTMRVLDEQ